MDCSCNAPTCEGSFRFRWRANNSPNGHRIGNELSDEILWSDTVADVQAKLLAMPSMKRASLTYGGTVDPVRIRLRGLGSPTAICATGGVTTEITFTNFPGDVPMLTMDPESFNMPSTMVIQFHGPDQVRIACEASEPQVTHSHTPASHIPAPQATCWHIPCLHRVPVPQTPQSPLHLPSLSLFRESVIRSATTGQSDGRGHAITSHVTDAVPVMTAVGAAAIPALVLPQEVPLMYVHMRVGREDEFLRAGNSTCEGGQRAGVAECTHIYYLS